MVNSSHLIERINALRVAPGTLGLFGLGQVGLVIRGPEGSIYIDPYLTDSDGEGGHLTRDFPAPLEPQTVTNADLVLISHDHVDHFDPLTLEPLSRASQQAHFVGPHTCDFGSLGISLERCTTPQALECFTALGATITAIPSAHPDVAVTERGHAFFGYVIEWNGLTIYHAGDTVIWPGQASTGLERGLIGVLERWVIDAAFLPINGRDYFRSARGLVGNMDHREAVELAQALNVRVIFPTHFDLFTANSVNPAHFVDYLYSRNPRRHHHLLHAGELYQLTRE